VTAWYSREEWVSWYIHFSESPTFSEKVEGFLDIDLTGFMVSFAVYTGTLYIHVCKSAAITNACNLRALIEAKGKIRAKYP